MNQSNYYIPPKQWSYPEFIKRYSDINNKNKFTDIIDFEELYKFPDLIIMKRALQMISGSIKHNDPGAKAISI
ncbi:MAG: hypothetical protein MJK11_13690, partial [Pseudomonadales bacterium]|nr:hypothetical protein [Pseudomonadales bacterium]